MVRSVTKNDRTHVSFKFIFDLAISCWYQHSKMLIMVITYIT